jgi:hypothetical protein
MDYTFYDEYLKANGLILERYGISGIDGPTGKHWHHENWSTPEGFKYRGQETRISVRLAFEDGNQPYMSLDFRTRYCASQAYWKGSKPVSLDHVPETLGKEFVQTITKYLEV